MSDVVYTDAGNVESEYDHGWRDGYSGILFCNPISVNAPGGGADYEEGFFDAQALIYPVNSD